MWSPNTILHPTDFSECSREAFEMACDLAAQTHGKVIVLHAHPPAIVATSEIPVSVDYEDEAEAREKLSCILPNSPDVVVEHRMIAGHPNDVIVQAVREMRPDLVVMGTQGRRGLSRLLLGSVAEHVLRHCECPILLAKPGTASKVASKARKSPSKSLGRV